MSSKPLANDISMPDSFGDHHHHRTPSSEILSQSLSRSSCSLSSWSSIHSIDSCRQNDISCGYVHRLQREYECLQNAFLMLTSKYARLQFHIRQLSESSPDERDSMIRDLERLAFGEVGGGSSGDGDGDGDGVGDGDADNETSSSRTNDSRAHGDHHQNEYLGYEANQRMGDIRRKQSHLIEKIRMQLCTLADAEQLEAITEEPMKISIGDGDDSSDASDSMIDADRNAGGGEGDRFLNYETV